MVDVFFAVQTPLGFTVRTTATYWQLIQRKHPEVIGYEAAIQQGLRQPEEVRRSTQDPTVHLFYTPILPAYQLVMVAKRLNGEGFLVTCYLSDKKKEGVRIWPTSA